MKKNADDDGVLFLTVLFIQTKLGSNFIISHFSTTKHKQINIEDCRYNSRQAIIPLTG